MKLFREEGCGADCSSLTELMLAERCGFRGQPKYFAPLAFRVRKAWAIWGRVMPYLASPGVSSGRAAAVRGGPGPRRDGKCKALRRAGPFYDRALRVPSDQGAPLPESLGDLGAGHAVLGVAGGVHDLMAVLAGSQGEHAAGVVPAEDGLRDMADAGILFRLAVELKEETGCDIRYINLSGGIGIPYRPEEEANDTMASSRKSTWVKSSRLMIAPKRSAIRYSSARVLLEETFRQILQPQETR